MLDFLKIDFNSKANDDATIRQGPVRFTVLTPHLIRMEFDPSCTFEDRPTQIVWHRQFTTPNFKKTVDNNTMLIETNDLVLRYEINEFGFHEDFLQITLKENQLTWFFGQENNTNLKGTVRTLDRVDGSIPLNPGLISRSGWSIVDDSQSLVFNAEGWIEERASPPGAKDLYFFGYGRGYTQCIIDFQKLSGKPPLLPRFALGNWWSRYWAYHQDELLALMRDFKERDIPLSVCIVDMDWHIVDTGNESSGWTGYSWNPALFPDPEAFIEQLHAMGLKTALNLHPASGVFPHERGYQEMASRLGVDPNTQEPIPFNIADPDFTKAYFEVLHYPLEDMGVDFWWLDWQQGTQTIIKGLDPLFWLNHLHFFNRARDGKSRPFIFSRWGGLGSQRYPIGFSGDTYITWDSLQFQPYFTATAANVGYGWWSHDIGGHMGGVEEPELYLRWIQYGVFSPILRMHCTNNPYHERRPWAYDSETERIAAQALRLRHAFIPYLYTAAWVNTKEGILPIRPMYHLYPEKDGAYQCPNQYTFGSELIAAPYTTALDEDTRLSRNMVWMPEGDWFDFFTGEHYSGGGWYAIYGDLHQIPVFAKAGAIVPLSSGHVNNSIDLPDTLTINVYPGADNTYTLYEDDGETLAYQKGEFALTKFNFVWQEEKCSFTIKPVLGQKDLLSTKRIYKIIFHAFTAPDNIQVMINGQEVEFSYNFIEDSHQLILRDIVLSTEDELNIHISSSSNLFFKADRKKETMLDMLKTFKMNSYIKQALDLRIDQLVENPVMLLEFADRMADSHILDLVETWLGKQDERILPDPVEAFQEVMNYLYHA
jgi:alpha-glucosidase (family GH31 glycosyl hydrolase)